MSKVISIQGNHSFNGYEVTTDMPVDKIQGTDFTFNQKQFVTHPTSTSVDFGVCTISGDGLWLAVAGYSGVSGLTIFKRSTTQDQFLFSSTIGITPIARVGLSDDGRYLIIDGTAPATYVYSRDVTTDVWTQRDTLSAGGADTVNMSSDGTYAVFSHNDGIGIYRKTPGADTWSRPFGITGIPTSATSRGVDISRNGERVVGLRFTVDTLDIFRKTGDTSWVLEESLTAENTGTVQINDDGDLIAVTSTTTTNIDIYSRSGTTWTYQTSIVATSGTDFMMSGDGNRLLVRDSGTYNGLVGRLSVYKRISNSNWELINTLDTVTSGFGRSSSYKAYYLSRDGSIMVASSQTISGVYVYDIENEVEFEQRIKTNILNFNDTLKITSALNSADHLVIFPSFNQAGSLLNDGSGNCSWGEPFDQGLNKSDAVQFDTIGISPNLGQTTTSSELQLSFRKINESYSGNCIKLRRSTDFTVAYALDAELDDSSNLTGAATYNSTGGTSSRGQFTATLSTSGTFIVDGTSLGSGDDGTRILFVGQNNQDENGIYTTTISGTSLTLDRATDFDGDGEVSNGDSFYITNGTVYADTGFKITTEDSITIGGASGSNLTFSTIDVLKDIGFDPDNTGSGVINLAAVSTMLEDDDGYIHTWYDQSGNSNDFTQTTQASQPQLLLSGGINWLPTASFDGTDDNLDAGDVLDIGTNTKWYVNAVTNPNKPAGIITKSTNGNPNRWALNVGSSGTIDWSSTDDAGSYSINGLTVTFSTTNMSSVSGITGGISFDKANSSDATLTMTFSAPINFSIGFKNLNVSSEGFTNFSTDPDSVSINANHSWDGTTLLYSSSSASDVSTLSWVGISTLTFTYTYPPSASTGQFNDSVFTFANAIYEDSVESTTAGSVNTGSAQIASFILDRNNGTQTLNSYINNSNIDTNVALTEDSTYNFNSTTSTLIGVIDGSGYFDGEISEIIIHSDLSNPERVGIEQDQANYYSITISEMPKINFKIDTTIASNYNLTFPASQGSADQVLINDGSGNLSWGTAVTASVGIGNSFGTDNRMLRTVGTGNDIEATDITINDDGSISIPNTTEANGSTSGSLLTLGGVGIAKNLDVGTTLEVGTTSELNGAVTMGSTLNITGALTASSTSNLNGVVNINDTTQSSAVSNGALVVDGGLGVAKNIFGGGTLNITGNSTLTGTLKILDTTDSSSSTSNGALVVSGGAVIGKNLVIGGDLLVEGTTTTVNSTTTAIVDPMFKVADGNPADTYDVGFYGEYVSGNNTMYCGLHRVGADSTLTAPEVAGKFILFDSATTEPGPLNVGDPGVAADLVVGDLCARGIEIKAETGTTNGSITLDYATGSNYTLVFPGAQGGTDQVLINDGSGNLSWGTAVTASVGIGNSFGTDNRMLRTVGTGNDIEATDITINDDGSISIPNTTVANGSTEGSIVTLGGIGVAKNLDVGTTLEVGTTSELNGAVSMGSTLSVTGASTISSTLKITDTTQSTSTTNGAFIVGGGVGIAKDIHVGGVIDMQETTVGDRILYWTNQYGVGIESSTLTQWSATNHRWRIGGTSVSSGTSRMELTDTNLDLNITTESSTSSTGALIVAGGVGIGKNLNVNGDISLEGTDSQLVFDDSTGVNVDRIYLNSNTHGIGIKSDDTLSSWAPTQHCWNIGGTTVNSGTQLFCIASTRGRFLHTTQSTTTANGALNVDGGVGIGKNLNVGGTVTITDTTQVTATGNGALVVSGGLSVDKAIRLGGKFAVPVRTVTASDSLDDDYILNVNSTSSATITLPDITDDQYNGVTYVIVKQTSNTVTLTTQAADKIITSTTEVDSIDMDGDSGERIMVMSNGDKWLVM